MHVPVLTNPSVTRGRICNIRFSDTPLAVLLVLLLSSADLGGTLSNFRRRVRADCQFMLPLFSPVMAKEE
jgi:hypothetical protein